MFRRLAQITTHVEPYQNTTTQGQFMTDQNKYFNTVSNIIPSATSGLKGFNIAIQSVDPTSNTYTAPPVQYANDIFISDKSEQLNKIAKECESSSIDKLIASQNPNNPIGCGWMYSPPPAGSPTPEVSHGFIGDNNGPNPVYNPGEYKKWFFDLQKAKRQILFDKCKALKACTDVDNPIFSGDCGYCTDTNQGIPIDSNGNPLYNDTPMGACSISSIITSGANCPVPTNGSSRIGPTPMTDKTCDPVNGRVSAQCLYNQVLSGGCSDKGALAIALSTNPPPNDYVGNIRTLDSVKIYNRVANPPLKLEVFSQGNSSIATVLQEVRQLATATTTNPTNSAIGASARDLCIQKGAIKEYDFCSDLPDTTTSPFDMGCLQTLFKKMGGQPAGLVYPTEKTMIQYNNMSNLGAIKQYWIQLINNMKNKDYSIQRDALAKVLGIIPEQVVKKAPKNSGIEVFWFSVNPSNGGGWPGFLRRTFETTIPQFPSGSTSIIPQTGMSEYVSFLALTDIRTNTDTSVKFNVLVDDGFWISINQPVDFDYYTQKNPVEDSPGYIANNKVQGITNYAFSSCSAISSKFPNIVKVFYSDMGGGGHTLQVTPTSCSSNGIQPFQSSNYTLTCEVRAPFINFEVNNNTMTLEDTRNPSIFSNYITTNALEYHVRTEERENVPGKKGFIRFNNANSYVSVSNITYQSWGSITMPFRLNTMPVKDSIISFWSGSRYFSIYLTPINGSSAQINITTNIGSQNIITTTYTININTWYMLIVANKGTGFDIFVPTFDSIINNKNVGKSISLDAGTAVYDVNGLYVPGKYSCNISIGGKVSGFGYATSSFLFDIAWLHFFDHYVNVDDIYRDSLCNWIFTQFPSSYSTYDIL